MTTATPLLLDLDSFLARAEERGAPLDARAAEAVARRPYDLRSTCITNWLRAGLPAAEVARRAGNSPEVIHRNYAGCLDDSEEDTTTEGSNGRWGGSSAELGGKAPSLPTQRYPAQSFSP
ncbi:hypothetical protein [Streptomyces sp. NPDC020817]|uniref:hypothetical protein n=1 Tax=Streptomyces sp. NPDC020817 TaxID=3365095 RepID=UPI0037AF4FD6